MRVVFMGSPEFAIPTLSSLVDEHQVIAVVCQPDRQAGRGRKLRTPATKVFAIERKLSLFQPKRVSEPAVIEQLANLKPDLIIVVAYGQILSQDLLDVPSVGSLNLHASLLPRWRGAAPIQAAILHGDGQTGVTIMEMDAGLDTGPILSQAEIAIEPSETGASLSDKLAPLGAKLLMETLPGYAEGSVLSTPQDETLATIAPMLQKTDGILDFGRTAIELERKIRAFRPWPGTYLTWNDRRLAVRSAHCASDGTSSLGRVVKVDGFPAVGTREGLLVLDEVQPAGKQAMPGSAFINGSPDFLNAHLQSS
jgi:methionyl-tRNA formyltransferase